MLEKVVFSQISPHLNFHNLISQSQSAYRSYHSTETAILKITSDLLSAADEGKISVLAVLDLSAAFYTVDNNILLHRLQHVFGIDVAALAWFKSYLCDRIQIVSVNGKHSSAQLSFGVP